MNTFRTSLAAITLLATAPAFAGQFDDEQVRQLNVSYAGLNVNTPAGAALLYTRITVAAQKVCDENNTYGPTQRNLVLRKCMKSAIARAVADVNSPALTAHAAAQSPKESKPVTVAKTK